MSGYVLFECRNYRIVRSYRGSGPVLEVRDGMDATGAIRWREPDGTFSVFVATDMILAAFEAGRKHEYELQRQLAAEKGAPHA